MPSPTERGAASGLRRFAGAPAAGTPAAAALAAGSLIAGHVRRPTPVRAGIRSGVRVVVAALAFAGSTLAVQANEIDGVALARQNACLACHQVDARRVGPPFAAIGERYAQQGDADATLDYLASAIQQGGRGRWGAIPMPAQPQVSDADARALAEWILGLPGTPRP